MSYISNLRKYIGHEPLINIGATVIVMNDKNEILLNLRSDTNTWGIIGVHQDGLVHISEICDRFIKHPSEVLSVGDIVKVCVLSVDAAKKRISLSIKQAK